MSHSASQLVFTSSSSAGEETLGERAVVPLLDVLREVGLQTGLWEVHRDELRADDRACEGANKQAHRNVWYVRCCTIGPPSVK